MGVGSVAKRRRTGTDSSLNSATPSRPKNSSGRGRGRPPNAPRDGRERPPSIAECFSRRCNDVLDRLNKKDHYNIFLEPVNTNDVAGYLDVIKQPMDFTTMRTKLSQQVYKSLGEFRKDLDLIWSNCLLFNGKEPTNVFSKKAIELRRLTEKLIVNTRRDLERDKEILNKWKEKHRKRRETMAVNAANAAARLHGGPMVIPSSSVISRDSRANLDNDAKDLMSSEFNAKDQNGRTPEQNALAEALKLQYSGTTGLFKKGLQNAPHPQYARPDGSLAPIPLTPYNPADDHWSPRDPQAHEVYRIDSAPQLYCDALPPSRESNPCRPRPNINSVYVKNYAESLYGFVKDIGPLAIEIVTDLLNPELVLKAQHDELTKQGLGMKEIAKRIKAAKLQKKCTIPSYRPAQNWGADEIITLADEIEKLNKSKLPLLPHLARTINELDGIKGLRKFLDKELVKEVDEVPPDVIDYTMPHGLNLETIAEIYRLSMSPTLRMSPTDIRCIEALRGTVQDFLVRKPADRAQTGPSLLTPSQLHDLQLRSQSQKRNRRIEAEKQASLISEHFKHTSQSEKRHSQLVSQRNVPKSEVGANPHAGMQAAAAAQLAYKGRASQPPSRVTSSSLPSVSNDFLCRNCGARDNLKWHAGAVRPNNMEGFCNACSVYWQNTRQHRPKELWKTSVGSLKPTGSPVSGRTLNRQGQPQSRSLTPAGSPNGVSRPPIQKRTPQSSSRRSPSSGGSRRRTPKAKVASGIIMDQSNPPSGLQHMPGLPNSIHAAAQKPHGPIAMIAQGLVEQQSPIEGTGMIGVQNSQSLYEQTQRPIRGSYTGNALPGRSIGAQIHLGNARVMNAQTFSGQQITALPLQHIQSTAGTSSGAITHHKQSFAQLGSSQMNAQVQNLVQNTGSLPFGRHPIIARESDGVAQAGLPTQVHMGNHGQAVQPNVHRLPGLHFGQAGRHVSAPAQNPTPSLPSGISNLGINAYTAQSGNLAVNSIAGFDNGTAPPGSNNGSANPVQGNSEQMMESLLFGDGGIAASTTGPPEFDF